MNRVLKVLFDNSEVKLVIFNGVLEVKYDLKTDVFMMRPFFYKFDE